MQTYLTVQEVAELLRVHEVTIQGLCRSGAIKAVRIGRQWRILRTDLDAYLAAASEVKDDSKKADGLAAFATRPTIAAVL